MSRVAVVQQSASVDKTENLAFAVHCIREAKSKDADLVSFPEFLMAYSPPEQSSEELCRIAESLGGEFTSVLRDAAKESSIDVVATIYEKSGPSSRVYDTALLIDRRGTLASVYRKLHLYDALGFRESDKLRAGEDVARPLEASIGILGMMICYDIRFPELARILTLMGMETLIVPSGWVQGDRKVEHWKTMLQARAIENGCYVIAPNQTGNIYTGHSLVVDPFGTVVLDMGEDEKMEVVEVDLELLRHVRKTLPLMRHRRSDVYAKYWDECKG
jgi:deaminated glutathione amidase